MPLSFDFWRTVQRLRVERERHDRTLARANREAAARRRLSRQREGSPWRLLALNALAIGAPVFTTLAVSPEVLRRNARLLLEAVALLV
jgi:hypothetical protein